MSPVSRVLVTNDDGIHSPGLYSLAMVAKEAGADVVIAAPAAEASGSGAAITAVEQHGRIILERRQADGFDGVPVYAVQAAPALIALIATHGTFGAPPDVVLSGVNRGANVGQAILHSGTVGAALTGGINEARGLAVSLDIGLDASESPRWATAAAIAGRFLPYLVRQRAGTVLNLNVPDLEESDVGGIKHAPLAPFGVVQTTMTEEGEGMVRMGVADSSRPVPPGTDAAWLADGYAVVTAIRSVCDVDLPERPDFIDAEPLDLESSNA